MFTVQEPERRRSGSPQASADHLRARSCKPSALPQVRQDGAASLCDLAATWLAAASPQKGRSRLRSQQESLTVAYSNHERTPKVQTATAYLETLNPEQRRAVEHGAAEGLPAPPLLVIAGAGSGKTNTLAHLIVQGTDPRRIDDVQFNRRPQQPRFRSAIPAPPALRHQRVCSLAETCLRRMPSAPGR